MDIPDQEPEILNLPVGTGQTGWRRETDSMGAIEAPAERYWGAQTQRALIHFNIGGDRMPKAIYHAYGYIKKASAIVNARLGCLPQWKADLISKVADEVIAGKLDDEFPLGLWQAGSGTQSNMNVNEVIANRAIQLAGGKMGSKQPIHPNDHVNMSQSSNDTFPTAMHVASVKALCEHLLPSVEGLQKSAAEKSEQWSRVVKIGRTHLQDATPLTVGQEWSGYAAQLEDAMEGIRGALPGLYRLAIGGTAVGTGINAPRGFGEETARVIAELTGYPFVTAPNKFAAQASLDALARASGALRGLAVALFKFANDMRWLGSGPRCGLQELILPANEPGSSIMPGKVNPTQAEIMLMICIRVIGLDAAVAMAAAEGNFELNAFRPLVIDHVLRSIQLLGDACDHFRKFLVEGVKINEKQLQQNVSRSVMMVTALSPVIGYDKAAEIAHQAVQEDLTLKEAALRSGVDEELYDRAVVPEQLTKPGLPGQR
ncbi:MAG TPA: class II fumarate hydratase [Terriglobia bacterium]|nr:class II fumarate hydratase [Terriglobia bacterium]